MAGVFQLFNEDAVAWLAGFAAGSVPLVVLDPGVPGRAPRRGRRTDPLIPAFPEARVPALLYEVHRVLARDRLCWWLTESAHAFKAAHMATRLGFAVGSPLVWDRGDGPGARVAFALPLARDRARSPGAELINAHRNAEFPTRLPSLLCESLILAASEPGEVVVDPLMGSGAVGSSALVHGRNYLGNDIAPLVDEVKLQLDKLGTSDGDNIGLCVGSRATVATGTAGQLTIF